jgi:SNF2 family DNA or RNA helicase
VTIRALWAHVDARTRYKHVQEFNTDPEIQVLLISYSIETAGLDMYEMRSNVMMVEPAYSAAKEHQAYHRVRRFGQTERQHVERLFTFNTFNEMLEWAQTRKQGPALAAWGGGPKGTGGSGCKRSLRHPARKSGPRA